MTDILLVTTGKSLVRDALEIRQDVLVLDCSVGRDSIFAQLESSMAEGVRILLTYRCPYILPERIFSKALEGAYNIHPTLLPAYPGLNPWQKIFEDGVKESGVTLHRMSQDADAGEIVAQLPFRMTSSEDLMSARHKSDRVALTLLETYFFNDEL